MKTRPAKAWLLRASAVAAVLVLWQGLSVLPTHDPRLIPGPVAVVRAAETMARSGELASDVARSLARVAIGFAIGGGLAIIVAMLTGRSRWFADTLGSVVQLFRPIPVIAFVPFAIIWFGLGEASKYFLIAWGAFFPVWLNAHIGIANVDVTYIRVARSLGASRQTILREVVIPHALPFIVAGARIGIAIAFVCLVAAEMTGAFGGIGYRISTSHLVFRVDKMIVGLIVLGILGAATDAGLAWIARILMPWLRTAQTSA